MARALINVPKQAKRGDVIEIKTLVSHPMETGYRRDSMGNAIPRDIINRFVCTYNGVEVFRADLFPAIAANPFLSFHTVATDSGEIKLSWTGDDGNTQTETVSITVV
jgi:sulfur-oxidizing protein SoxZ